MIVCNSMTFGGSFDANKNRQHENECWGLKYFLGQNKVSGSFFLFTLCTPKHTQALAVNQTEMFADKVRNLRFIHVMFSQVCQPSSSLSYESYGILYVSPQVIATGDQIKMTCYRFKRPITLFL